MSCYDGLVPNLDSSGIGGIVPNLDSSGIGGIVLNLDSSGIGGIVPNLDSSGIGVPHLWQYLAPSPSSKLTLQHTQVFAITCHK